MNYVFYELTGEPFENRDSIDVFYNGTKYTLPFNEEANAYGATHYEDDGGNNAFDFSEYPLSIVNDIENSMVVLIVPADTPLPITISAGYTETTQAVWEKVGSGGGSSDEGYEINNPTLTITPLSSASIAERRFFVDSDGYFSVENVTPTANLSYTTLVFAEDVLDNYSYQFEFNSVSGTSNAVNCTYDSGGRRVIITDPTQDASISVSFGLN